MTVDVPLHRALAAAFVLLLAFGLAACGDKVADTAGTPSAGGPTKLLLEASPGPAVAVLDAKKKSAGDEVIVVGRVSSLETGFAAFTLTDDSVPYCGKDEACGCKTPWDYCCEVDAAKAGRLPVELRDAAGEPVATADTGLRLLDLVAVRGTLAATESGGLMVVAKDGWFRVERPELPDGLKWP